MTRRSQWTLSAFAFVAIAGIVSAIFQYATFAVLGSVVNYGYEPDPEGIAEYLSELPERTFSDAAPDAVTKARGIDTFLFRSTDKAHRSAYGKAWQPWNQGNCGTCTSMAFGLAVYTSQSVDWTLGKLEKAPLECATEPIYGGSRTSGRMPPLAINSGGDGSYGGACARWLSGRCKDTSIGGVLFRQKYADVDLSTYSIPLSRQWGATGVPQRLAREAAEHRASCVQVTTFDELAASVESGFPVVLCSTVGYGGSTTRDADGFLQRGTPWAHAMLVTAVRFQKNGSPRNAALIQNSWGAWLTGPKWPPDQPDGSFWARQEDVQSALDQQDCWAVGSVSGFRFRELHNGGWLEAQ